MSDQLTEPTSCSLGDGGPQQRIVVRATTNNVSQREYTLVPMIARKLWPAISELALV